MLCATTGCTFSTSQLPKVVREWCVVRILSSKCASRHNGVHFFIPHLARWLRTRCFSEPTFDPPEAQIIGKTLCFATFLPFRASAFFFLLTPPLLWSALFYSFLLSASDHLCFSSVHIVGSLTSTLPSLNIYIYIDPRYGLRSSGRWSHCNGLYYIMIYVCIYIYIYLFIYLHISTYINRSQVRVEVVWQVEPRQGFLLYNDFCIYIYIYIQLSTYISTYIYIYLYRSQVWVEVVWQVEPLQGFILYNQKCMYMYLYINTSQHISLYIHIYK